MKKIRKIRILDLCRTADKRGIVVWRRYREAAKLWIFIADDVN